MEVQINYEPARSTHVQQQSIWFPSLLEIVLRWEEDASEEELFDVNVTSSIQVTLRDGPNAVLNSVVCLGDDERSWQILASVVGLTIWGEVHQLLVDGMGEKAIEVESADFEPLTTVWNEIARMVSDGRVRVLPSQEARDGADLPAVFSDPEFVGKGRRLLSDLFGKEVVDRALSPWSD